MADDLAFELQIERAKREVSTCVDVEQMRNLTNQMIELMIQQRSVCRDLLNGYEP